MNGQRIVQVQKGSTWSNKNVSNAGPLKPGIYNVSSAADADVSKTHLGAVVHTDATNVYQQAGKKVVKHQLNRFKDPPAVGQSLRITYEAGGKAKTEEISLKQTQSRGR